jgi:hypothetical protein
MKRLDQVDYYRGIRTVPYDLLKEVSIALVATLVLVAGLAAVLSSPDQSPETIQSWAQKAPVDLVTTATGELAGTTVSSQYGAPYNSGTASVQGLGFFSPQTWFGVRQPVDPAQDFVLTPLQRASVGNPDLAAAVDTYTKADAKQQQAWLDAYGKALKDAKAGSDGSVTVAAGDYGPLPTMMTSLLALAGAGGLDGALLSNGHFYQTDYTMPLLFMGDGTYLASLASDAHLLSNQWGMMNETGSYPGQSWLWLYTMWYQLPPFAGNANADIMVVLMMTLLSAGLVFIPLIPGLRDIPRWVPIYRLIWRDYYREERTTAGIPKPMGPVGAAPASGVGGID